MDLALFAKVLWRSRLLVLFGVVAACALGVLSMARVDFKHGRPELHYRNPALYESTVQVLVTQHGFPEGRTVFSTTPTTLPSGRVVQPPFADPSRFAALAVLYAQIVSGNTIQRMVFGPKPKGLVVGTATPAPGGGGFLPVVQISGVAQSPRDAMRAADTATTDFSRYLNHQQALTHTPIAQRVILRPIAGPLRPTVYQSRKKTRAIFAVALVLMLTIVAAFARENLRRRRMQDHVELAPDAAHMGGMTSSNGHGDLGDQQATPSLAE